MNLVQRVENWGDRHHPLWMDIIRIALGVFLCIKGIEFATNMSTVMEPMQGRMPFSSFMMVGVIGHYIVFAHIMGGFFLVIGFLTRFSCLANIPILLGAIFFINLSPNLMRPFSELVLSIVVLILLVYFMVIGGGRWSLDKVIDKTTKM